MSTKSLIVGGVGQLGNRIARHLGSEGVLLTSRNPSDPRQLRLDLAELAGDPRLAYELIEQYNPAAVYCTGGMTHVDACECDPGTAISANCHGPAALAQAAASFGVPFVFISTDYVFDGQLGPYGEQDAPNPLSVYGN